MTDYKFHYDWLVDQMKERIGPPPEGVSYPVWAWHTWREDSKRPDLRAKRWRWGVAGLKYYRLEIEIPDSKVKMFITVAKKHLQLPTKNPPLLSQQGTKFRLLYSD